MDSPVSMLTQPAVPTHTQPAVQTHQGARAEPEEVPDDETWSQDYSGAWGLTSTVRATLKKGCVHCETRRTVRTRAENAFLPALDFTGARSEPRVGPEPVAPSAVQYFNQVCFRVEVGGGGGVHDAPSGFLSMAGEGVVPFEVAVLRNNGPGAAAATYSQLQ
eukprot:Hpha_TRINITY_DN7146_c0_g2::TRINITY_DN7146_c0_g2_i1::g.29836::m.29836